MIGEEWSLEGSHGLVDTVKAVGAPTPLLVTVECWWWDPTSG